MTDEGIKRINELYHKAKTPEGLTPEEKEEQAALRKQFVEDFKRNLRGTLDNIDIKEKDGSITHVKDIPLKKKNIKE
ncbi:MAG: DUF896 domain-containing protein [Lachnospiraceae bacterium]|nr:DUF896 domain-containing protein [Lachnospiraceae bacterium]